MRGRRTRSNLIAGADTTILDARWESCGACVAYYPTGALADKMSMGTGEPDRLVTANCTFCGVGCQFDLIIKDHWITQVTSNPHASANGMHRCVKGRLGYDFVHDEDMLTVPLVRWYLRDSRVREHDEDRGDWVEVDWKTALDLVAEMTRRAQGRLEIYTETLLEISPEDAAKMGLNGKKRVRVVSRRGEMLAKALVTDRVPPGLVFGNFHFPTN